MASREGASWFLPATRAAELALAGASSPWAMGTAEFDCACPCSRMLGQADLPLSEQPAAVVKLIAVTAAYRNARRAPSTPQPPPLAHLLIGRITRLDPGLKTPQGSSARFGSKMRDVRSRRLIGRSRDQSWKSSAGFCRGCPGLGGWKNW